jgi:predicted phosphodiesterase
MRIAVISDIHGNDVALAAVVADIQTDRIETIVCLGDTVQGGAQPAEVVKRLRDLACPVVLGNADDLLLYGKESKNEEPPNEWIDAVREWQLTKLSPDDRAFIAAFQPTIEIPLPNGKRLLCAHGSPQHFNHVIMPDTPDDEVRTKLGPIDNAIVCGGHTHTQQIRQLGENFFFNPGSVSLPVRHDTIKSDSPRANRWAEYAVLTVEDSGWESVEFRRIPYDVDQWVAIINGSGMADPQNLSDLYREA